MLKVAVCGAAGDEYEILKNYCKRFFDNREMNYELKIYTSQGLILGNEFPDVLFLAVDSENFDGILLKEVLEKLNASSRILFFSTCEKRMIETIGKNVYAFLKLPIQYKRFQEKMKIVVEDWLDEKKYIYCKRRNEIEKIYWRDILFVEAYSRYTKIFTRGKQEYYVCDRGIGEWYADIEGTELERCHRSYVVNMRHIQNVGKMIEMINGGKIPIGNGYKEVFYKSYHRFLGEYEKNGADML